MASTSETGHGKNVINFGKLITELKNFPDYKPANPDLDISNLEVIRDKANEIIKAVPRKLAPYTLAVDDREAVYDGIDRLATRIDNAIAATKGGKAILEDAKTFTRKIKGERAVAIEANTTAKTSTPAAPGAETDEEDRRHSVSQQSYTSIAEHLDGIIQLLSSTPAYAPNESALSVAGLTTLHEAMETKNKVVDDTYSLLRKSRRERDAVLYTGESSLVDIALQAKKYVKSMKGEGANSAEYSAVAGIKFKRYGKK